MFLFNPVYTWLYGKEKAKKKVSLLCGIRPSTLLILCPLIIQENRKL